MPDFGKILKEREGKDGWIYYSTRPIRPNLRGGTQLYTPKPMDTAHSSLSSDILAVSEVLARNTHEVWAADRIAEG
jgi:hypothetical protein